jgi:hypothetical protein
LLGKLAFGYFSSMTSTEITETIKLLNDFHKVHSACHVTTFTGYRKAEDGSEKKITVTIRDSGENAPSPNYRFYADASWEDGYAASGDGPSVKAALGSMKWFWKVNGFGNQGPPKESIRRRPSKPTR